MNTTLSDFLGPSRDSFRFEAKLLAAASNYVCITSVNDVMAGMSDMYSVVSRMLPFSRSLCCEKSSTTLYNLNVIIYKYLLIISILPHSSCMRTHKSAVRPNATKLHSAYTLNDEL